MKKIFTILVVILVLLPTVACAESKDKPEPSRWCAPVQVGGVLAYRLVPQPDGGYLLVPERIGAATVWVGRDLPGVIPPTIAQCNGR